jgi:phenylacetate-CoA ligase
LDPVDSDRWRDRLQTLLRNARWFDCFRLSDTRLEGYHRELQTFRPACVLAYASALAPLAEVVEGLGETPSYPTRCFVTGAEKLFPHDREIVERVFDRPVHEQYGSRDVGLMGFQLNPREEHHFTVDWAKILVEPMEAGEESSVLATKLQADAMPMIRYRVGDLGSFPGEARPGWPAFRLERVLGREVDKIWLPDGRWFNALGIPHMMKDFPVRDFRFTQREDYSIIVEVVKGDRFSQEDRERILRIVAENLPGLQVDFVECQEIPKTKSGKRRPVISLAPAGRREEET